MSELNDLINEIKKNTKQISINKVDEVKVMQCMINDSEFKLGVFDKNLGLIGERSPYEESRKFIKNIISGTTGLDGKDSKHLAESYEFTKRDASFLVDNAKDFINVYTTTGRKINLIQNGTTEASVFTRDISSGTKSIPDKENPGAIKQVKTDPYTKLVCTSRRPKYVSSK